MVKNRYKFTSICLYATSVGFYIMVLSQFFVHHDIKHTLPYLVLGANLLNVANYYRRKAKEQEGTEKEKKE